MVDLPRATRANPGQATHDDSALPCTGGSDDGSVWGWLSPTVQTLAAVGALAYATMRVSLQYFYDSFGLTPESVGSNSATILAQSSLRVVEFGALFALVPVMLVLALFVAFDHWLPWLWPEAATRRLGRRMLLALPAVLVPYPLYQWLTNGRVYSFVIPLSLLGLWALAIVTLKQERLTLQGIRHGRPAVAVVLWSAAAITWIVLTSLAKDGREAGACARAGQPVRYIHTHRHLPWMEPIPVLHVMAERVDQSEVDNLGVAAGGRVLYLGQSGGTAVLWDVEGKHTMLISAATTIRLQAEAQGAKPTDECEAVLSY